MTTKTIILFLVLSSLVVVGCQSTEKQSDIAQLESEEDVSNIVHIEFGEDVLETHTCNLSYPYDSPFIRDSLPYSI